VWVSDITYLLLANGDWAYLCVFQDMAGKRVVGWQVGATMPEELVTKAFNGLFGPSRPRRACLCTPTAAGSTAVTPIGNYCMTTKPCARRAAAATATITPYRVRPRPKACGRASKRRSSKSASDPFLPT